MILSKYHLKAFCGHNVISHEPSFNPQHSVQLRFLSSRYLRPKPTWTLSSTKNKDSSSCSPTSSTLAYFTYILSSETASKSMT